MKKLIVKRSILYLSKMYAPGDCLPANNPGMVSSWLAAKSAEWLIENPPEEAIPETQTGAPDNENGNPDNKNGVPDNENGNFDTGNGEQATGETAAVVTDNEEAAALARLSVPKLRQKAAAKGIDTSGAQNKEQLITLLTAGALLNNGL